MWQCYLCAFPPPLPRHTHTYQLGCRVVRNACPDPGWSPWSFPLPSESLCPLHLDSGVPSLDGGSFHTAGTSHRCRQQRLKRPCAEKNPRGAAETFVPNPVTTQVPKEDLDGPGRQEQWGPSRSRLLRACSGLKSIRDGPGTSHSRTFLGAWASLS